MREKLMRFMAGRNGNDALNRFILVVDLVLMLLSAVFSHTLGRFLYPLVLVLLGLTYYRMLSRDLYKRQRENAWYYKQRTRVVSSLRLLKERWVQRKDYCFFACPSCRTTLRVPRGRGKIKIVCRKCGASFVRKS